MVALLVSARPSFSRHRASEEVVSAKEGEAERIN